MHYKTKGVVLISVLLIVLLLSSIAVVIGNNYFVSFKRAQYLEFQTVSLNIFSSIESLALKKIDNELKFNSKRYKLTSVRQNLLDNEKLEWWTIGSITKQKYHTLLDKSRH